MKKFLILLLIFMLSFLSCKKVEKPSCFINEWKSTKKPWPYGAKLKINNDSTFLFFGAARTETFNSRGKWRILNDTLILTSKEVVDKNCAKNFNDNCIEIQFVKRADSTETNVKCEKSEHFIIFKNEKFYFKNDTLRHKSNKDFCGLKNDFVKCNRS